MSNTDPEVHRRLGAFLRGCRQLVPANAKVLGAHSRRLDRVGKVVTQLEVAEAIGVSRTWYALLEEGGANASASLLARLSEAFSLDRKERIDLFTLAIPELKSIVKPDGQVDDRTTCFPPDISHYSVPVAHPGEIEQAERRLSHIREQFFRGALEPSNRPRPRVFNSWVRCRAANVVPHTSAPIAFPPGVTLTDLRQTSERFLSAVRPVATALERSLSGSECVVVTANGDGVIIDVLGDAEPLRRAYREGAELGGDASEAAIGTNAIGTAIADCRPIQLLGAEHYQDAWQSNAAAGAPIRCPVTDKIIGVLGIGCSYQLVPPHLLSLVVQGALEIEERLAASVMVA